MVLVHLYDISVETLQRTFEDVDLLAFPVDYLGLLDVSVMRVYPLGERQIVPFQCMAVVIVLENLDYSGDLSEFIKRKIRLVPAVPVEKATPLSVKAQFSI